MIRPVLTFLLALFTSIQSFPADLRNNELLVGGGKAESCGLAISGMNLSVRRDQPAMAIGMQQIPGGATEYTYVLMIKGDEKRQHLATYSSRIKSDGSEIRDVGYFEIAGKRISFVYAMVIDPAGKQPRETLTLNDQKIDLKEGRVALVDLTGKEVTWQQVNEKMPPKPTIPADTAEVDRLGRESIKHLKKNVAVRTFLN